MRILKWVSALTILALPLVMLPATMAEDEIIISMEEAVDEEFGIGPVAFDDSLIAPENESFDLDGLGDDLLISTEDEYAKALPAPNASGDFEIDEDGVLIRYRGFERNVVIPDGVKSIGEEAFSNADFIESVSIPNSATYIGEYAFSGCAKLNNITLPNSVTKTGSGVFYACDSLANVQLSNSLTTLPSGFFSECDSLKSIILPDGVSDIERSAFGYCTSLESITIPSSVTIIDREAFSGSNNVVIRGTAGSYAERYANGMGIPFNAPIVSIEQEPNRIYDDGGSYEALILYINQSLTLTASQKPADLTRALAWSSSDTNIVTVDQNGIINGISQGTAIITVNTTDGKGKAAQIKVVVPEPTEINIDEYWDEEDYKIVLGQTMTISADKMTPYANVTEVEMPISWSTSDSSVISIEPADDDKTKLKGNHTGKAVITASTPDGGKSSIEMEVIRPAVESIKIDQTGPVNLYPGQNYGLSATLTPAEAEGKLTWSSDDTIIATVNQDGIVTAVKPGDARIWVYTDNNLEEYIDIHVLTPPQKITLAKTEATLAVGDTLALKKKLTPDDAETDLAWSSSKPSVATVTQNGVVTALKAGKATITVATDNGKSASATITVKPAPKKVRLNRSKATLGVREKLTLTATLSPSNAYTTLSWKSGNPSVAAVSKQGVVTPKRPGTAVITVTTANGKTAKATVTVKAAPKKVSLNKSGTVTLKKGKKLKLKATLPKDTASALTWTSSKPKVASVDGKGTVRALKKGSAVITVKTFNGRTARVTIRVK